MSTADLLFRGSLFADLRDNESAALAGCLGRRVFAKDRILFHKGSSTQSLYLIKSGAVRIFAHSETDQEITLDVYGQGECFVRRPSSIATSVRPAQCPWKGQLSTHFGAMISCAAWITTRRCPTVSSHCWPTDGTCYHFGQKPSEQTLSAADKTH